MDACIDRYTDRQIDHFSSHSFIIIRLQLKDCDLLHSFIIIRLQLKDCDLLHSFIIIRLQLKDCDLTLIMVYGMSVIFKENESLKTMAYSFNNLNQL